MPIPGTGMRYTDLTRHCVGRASTRIGQAASGHLLRHVEGMKLKDCEVAGRQRAPVDADPEKP